MNLLCTLLLSLSVLASIEQNPNIQLLSTQETESFLAGFLESYYEKLLPDRFSSETHNLTSCISNFWSAFSRSTNNLLEAYQLAEMLEAVRTLRDILGTHLGVGKTWERLEEILCEGNLKIISQKILSQPLNLNSFACELNFLNGNITEIAKCSRKIIFSITSIYNPISDLTEGLLQLATTPLDFVGPVHSGPILLNLKQAIVLAQTCKSQSCLKAIRAFLESTAQLHTILKPFLNGPIASLFERIQKVDQIDAAITALRFPVLFHNIFSPLMKSVENSDYKLTGKLLIEAMEFLTERPESVFTEALEIFQGFVIGVNQAGTFGQIRKCIKQVPYIFDSVSTIIELLEEIDWNDFEQVVSVLKTCIKLSWEILRCLKECSKVPSDIIALIERIKSITASEIGEQVMRHTLEIFSDVFDSIFLLKNSDYETVGYNFGDIIFKVFIFED